MIWLKILTDSRFISCLVFFLLLICAVSCEVKIETNAPLSDSNISIEDFKINSNIADVLESSEIRLFANGRIISREFPLDSGQYNIVIGARGTLAYDVLPKAHIFINDSILISDVQLYQEYEAHVVHLKVVKTQLYRISIEFDSDGLDEKGNDRDIFIESIAIHPASVKLRDVPTKYRLVTEEFKKTRLTLADFYVAPSVGHFVDQTAILIQANGEISSKELQLLEGEYTLNITAKGTNSYEVYPKIKINLSDSVYKEIQLGMEYLTTEIPMKVRKAGVYKINIVFDSDGVDDKGNDRDVIIKSLLFRINYPQ